MTEREILRAIRLELGGRSDLVLWRNSTGTAEYYDRSGRPHRVPYGLVPGASDLIGILAPSGRLVALEVKTARGRVSKDQKMFLNLVRRMGGIGAVVRSVDDAIDAIEGDTA